MISRGVQISVAGDIAVREENESRPIHFLPFFFFFSFFTYFFKSSAFVKIQRLHTVYSYHQQKPVPPHLRKHPTP